MLDEKLDKPGMRAAMAEASKLILDGFELRTDVSRTHYPNRFRDARGTAMWERVIELINKTAAATTVATQTTKEEAA
jgi:hypothetical protein